MEDHLVQALQRLIENTPGGRKAVADAIRANEQSLYQIVAGVPLSSGRARSVGRRLREKLDNAFPGWASRTFEPGAARIEVTGHAPTVSVRPAVSIDDAARTIAEALMKLDGQQRRSAEGALQILVSTPDQWPAVAALLRSLAEPAPKGGEGLGESPASLGRGQAAGGRK